jgi:hypothetical protein
MAVPQPVTETVILQLKSGVNLQDAASNSGSSSVDAFVESTNIIKAQTGALQQFWGHQVEDPNIFVWCIGSNSKPA